MSAPIDHVAIEVADFERRLGLFTEQLGMRLIRRGKRTSTGQQIAMIGDGHGFMLELVEAEDGDDAAAPKFLHIALRVDDVDGVHDELVSGGLSSVRAPHPLGAAKADTALLADEGGLEVQVIRYDDDSPDLQR